MLDRNAEFLRARVRPAIPTRANFWIKERAGERQGIDNRYSQQLPAIVGQLKTVDGIIASEAAAATSSGESRLMYH